MAPDEPRGYRLTPRALAGLDDIWRHSAETWSAAQADRQVDALAAVFELIAARPGPRTPGVHAAGSHSCA